MTETKTEKPNHTTYIPRAKEMVWTRDRDLDNPTNEDLPPTMAFVVRRATRDDKIKYILRMKSKLTPGDALDKKSLRDFFKNENAFLCIEDEEVTMVISDYIIGPVILSD